MLSTLRARAALRFLILLSSCAAVVARASAQSPPNPAEVTFLSGHLVLHGFIYKPEGDGPFPAVLWNHGSERRPGWLPELAPTFLKQGYVFFIPHRRGHGRSPGDYIMDLLGQASESGGRTERSTRLVQLMEVHLEDQIAALSYLKSLSYVDANRIAVAGCSFGGIQTVLMAEKGLGVRAAVDFAGAAQTWSEAPDLRQRMRKAVQNAAMPILFVQAQNDYDLAPSHDLAEAMEKSGKPHATHIYPKFGKTNQDAHEFCVHGGTIWEPDVFAFLNSSMH